MLTYNISSIIKAKLRASACTSVVCQLSALGQWKSANILYKCNSTQVLNKKYTGCSVDVKLT